MILVAGNQSALAILYISDCAESVMFQFKDVVRVVEWLCDTLELHWLDAGEQARTSLAEYYHGRQVLLTKSKCIHDSVSSGCNPWSYCQRESTVSCLSCSRWGAGTTSSAYPQFKQTKILGEKKTEDRLSRPDPGRIKFSSARPSSCCSDAHALQDIDPPKICSGR